MPAALISRKAADVAGQLVMLVVPVIIAALARIPWMIGGMLILFTVGTWQLLSFIIHLVIGRQAWMSGGRRIYAVLLLLLALFGVLVLVRHELVLEFLVTACCAGGFLAFFYFIISIDEWQRLRKSGRRAGRTEL